jgi:hypothetical protein
MGRMKDLFIELQNEYGYNLEDLPEGFSMEEYLNSQNIKEDPQLFCQIVKNIKKTQ